MKKGKIVIFSAMIGAVVGGIGISYLQGKQRNTSLNKVNKFKGYYQILNQWLSLKQDGKSVVSFFEGQGYKDIAIYGMGEMGNRLYEELKKSNINVKYAIDKTAYYIYPELEIMDMEEDKELPKVDVIVVTATFAFGKIEEILKEKTDSPIVSLEDIIFQI